MRPHICNEYVSRELKILTRTQYLTIEEQILAKSNYFLTLTFVKVFSYTLWWTFLQAPHITFHTLQTTKLVIYFLDF